MFRAIYPTVPLLCAGDLVFEAPMGSLISVLLHLGYVGPSKARGPGQGPRVGRPFAKF